MAEVQEVSKSTILTNPDTKMKFPVCVIQPPLQRPEYRGGAWNLSITVEVWAATQYEAMKIFDLVKIKLLELNFMLTNNTPLMNDPVTKKWRYGGYFEVLWNAITNFYLKNR